MVSRKQTKEAPRQAVNYYQRKRRRLSKKKEKKRDTPLLLSPAAVLFSRQRMRIGSTDNNKGASLFLFLFIYVYAPLGKELHSTASPRGARARKKTNRIGAPSCDNVTTARHWGRPARLPTMDGNGYVSLASLPIELVGMIVNGRDGNGRAFMDPRWRPMARMACRLLRAAVENPAPWDVCGLGDPQALFRRARIRLADVHRNSGVAHARRNRWHRGMLVCASAVAEWVATAPVLDAGALGALTDRMVSEWAASRANAHLTLLGSNRPEAIDYALDPRNSTAFAVTKPFDWDVAAYGFYDSLDDSTKLDAQRLSYAMVELAVRRCPAVTVRAILDATAAAPWFPSIQERADGDDGDDYGMPSEHLALGLARESVRASALLFDRADLPQQLPELGAVLAYVGATLQFGAVQCAALSAQRQSGLSPAFRLTPTDIEHKVGDWARGYCPGSRFRMERVVEIHGVLAALTRDLVLPPEALARICLSAIAGDAVDTASWALTAMGHEVTGEALLRATNKKPVDLVAHAVATHSRCHNIVYACGSRAAAWLCDLLAYEPTDGDLPVLAASACAHASRQETQPERWPCSIARVAFVLLRWPRALWASGDGVGIVRRAFASCVSGVRMRRDAVDLIDAVKDWCEAVGVTHQTMRRALSLHEVVLLHADDALLRRIAGAWCGIAWPDDCGDVCYGTCARTGHCTPLAAAAVDSRFCNGRPTSDVGALMAWCTPPPGLAADSHP
ncbi:hypothetical protein psal_cds_883 [Pandoravirus salinus]|uniref:Uncharacterized protein n=1 Tax=Pandoravirus salinus TaxID=1349410 RepID=S4W335_9VIRU|nr:hypothetical protein psal_cds_883 [Pandoravirus salinus]AGO84962.2 hypothetical protein psal_cds_883 [Pandoravirus salinus]